MLSLSASNDQSSDTSLDSAAEISWNTKNSKKQKRARDSPQKSIKARKLSYTGSSSSCSQIRQELPTGSKEMEFNPQSFVALLRNEEVKIAFNEIIKPSVVEAVKSSLVGISEKVKKLEEISSSHSTELQNIKDKLEALDQQSRSRNLIINGLPEKPDEKLPELFMNFAGDYLLTILKENDLTSIFRLGKQVRGGTRPVLIKFKELKLRSEIYRARTLLRKMDTGIGQAHPAPVFINEDLSPGRAALYSECRSAVKKKKLFTVWTLNGNIWAKITKTGDPFKITKTEDVDCLVTPTVTFAEKAAETTE